MPSSRPSEESFVSSWRPAMQRYRHACSDDEVPANKLIKRARFAGRRARDPRSLRLAKHPARGTQTPR
jgi:hypothetical protein